MGSDDFVKKAVGAAQNQLARFSTTHGCDVDKLLGRHGSRPDEVISELRYKLAVLLVNPITEASILFVILLNFALLIVETDSSSNFYPHPEDPSRGPAKFVIALNYMLSAIYVLELIARVYVMRSALFFDAGSLMDAFIVMIDLFMMVLDWILGDMPRITVLRCFRLIRVSRMFKALAMFKELHYLLYGFACAMKAIFWGMIMVVVTLIMWSILAVQIVHPVNRRVAFQGQYDGCNRCPHAFETVWASFNTFFQTLVAGDSWGTVALPIIEEEPMTFVFFAAVLVTVSLAIMNLILAVIVDAGQDARAAAIEEQKARDNAEYQDLIDRLKRLCESLDADKSGELSADELTGGCTNNEDFRETLVAMQVPMNDVSLMLRALDKDCSGTVSQAEFLDELQVIRNGQLRTLVCSLRFAVGDMRNRFRDFVRLAEQGKFGIEQNTQTANDKIEDGMSKEKREEKAPSIITECDSASERLVQAVRDMQEQADMQRQVLSNIDGAVKALVLSCMDSAHLPPLGTHKPPKLSKFSSKDDSSPGEPPGGALRLACGSSSTDKDEDLEAVDFSVLDSTDDVLVPSNSAPVLRA